MPFQAIFISNAPAKRACEGRGGYPVKIPDFEARLSKIRAIRCSGNAFALIHKVSANKIEPFD